MNSNITKPNGHLKAKRIDLYHYFRLLLEKKYWIISITLFIQILWILIYPKILNREKVYDFTTVIRFDDPRTAQSASGVDDRFARMEMDSKIRVITTTEFLTEIVDSLKLNIRAQTKGLRRNDIFAYINLEPEKLHYGQYELKRSGREAQLLFTNKQEGKENFLLATYKLSRDTLLNIGTGGIKAGIYMWLFKDHESLKFICIPTRYAIEGLRANINLRLNQQQTLLNISFTNSDPILGTTITNVIANEFIRRSLEFKRSRTSSAMAALSVQLQASKEQLEAAEEELKNFRERNPNIYLTNDISEYNHTISTYEGEQETIQNNLERLEQLISEKNQSQSASELALAYQEILSFLQEKSVVGIRALSQQYSGLVVERNGLVQQGYSDENPRLSEINRLIGSMQQTIDERAGQFKEQEMKRADELSKTIQNSQYRMRQSPSKEMQLAKLQRDRDSRSQVYSSVMLRYNEIKTADASITPDAYLLEKAQVPIVIHDIREKIIKLFKFGLGLILGLSLSIALFIGLDFIWHRARSVEDMEQVLSLPVLASIPMLSSGENLQAIIENGKKMDPLLVTIDYTPSMGGDAFRNLRTKLILDRDKDEKQQILITSHMPNEGKSLVASNLAITFAQLKKPTLLIDADMRRGVIHNSFLCSKKPGLADLLSRGNEINRESISKIIQKTTIPNLYLITSGSSVPNPTELLINEKIEKLLNHLKNQFNYVIIDTPPIEFIPDAFVLNKIVNNMLIITRYKTTNLNQLSKKIREYTELKDGIRGTILNGSMGLLEKKYQAYSYYKY